MPRDVMHSSHWGVFTARTEGGRLVDARPFERDPDPSELISAIPQANATVRVDTPVARRGWLEHGPGGATERRGADTYVELSWNEALELVATELRRVRSQHGNAAIFGGSYGWASAGRFHHAKSQLTRFLNCFGGCTAQIYNYSYAAASAILPYVLGNDATARGVVTSWPVLVENTGLWVMFGGLPLKSSQIESGGVGRHEVGTWLRRASRAGVRFVSISPLRDDAPEAINAEWIAPRPTTDTAVMLGLAHTLLAEGLQDEAFLTTHCVGWERLRAYLLGEEDGQPKSADWAARIADVDADDLRGLARRMAASRTLISVTWSLQRADHGEQPFWMAIALAAMLGQIGLPGGGFGFAYANAAAIGNERPAFPAPTLPMGRNEAGSAIPVARIADMMLHAGGEYDFLGERRRYPDIRLVYWAGGNPFHHHQDLNRLLQAWRRPETIVVHEPWWTSTARHADVVLPATTSVERNDIAMGARDRFLVAMQQAVAPHAKARSDYEILSGLAQRLGIGETFTEGRDEMGWLRHLYAQTRDGAAERGVALPDFEAFWEAGYVEAPTVKPDVLFADFRRDPSSFPLATPSGRIELFSERLHALGYDDCGGHPAWLEPAEWLGGSPAQRFPLHLISNMPRNRLHSQLDMAGPSQRSKVQGREPCRMNPVDAASRGLQDGEVVRLYNERGSCLAGLRLSEEVRRGVVQMFNGAWFDPIQRGTPGSLDVHGNANVLTADRGTSKLGQGPSAHSALVEVERFSGELPPITAFIPPLVETQD